MKNPRNPSVLHGVISSENSGLRLDRAIASLFSEISRSYAKKLIAEGRVVVNDSPVRVLSRKVFQNTRIEIYPAGTVPKKKLSATERAKKQREKIKNEHPEIIYWDRSLLVFDKPAKMPTQRTRSLREGSAKDKLVTLLALDDAKTLHPAHRLDAPVSGLLCFALGKQAAANLQKQFQNHTAQRIYLAIVEGEFFPEATTLVHHLIADRSRSLSRIGDSDTGKQAKTNVRVLAKRVGKSLLMIAPQTGRMHQIRVQLAQADYPIIGDSRYGSGGASRLALHAFGLTLVHPGSRKKLSLEAPPREDFWALWP